MLIRSAWPWAIFPAVLLFIQTAGGADKPAPESGADAKADGPVEVKVVKYDALKDTIKQFKGQVVVVDFWSVT